MKLSKTSKMPCKSWSLQAIETCPGAKDSSGNLVPACSGCYATTGMYNMPNVKAPRQFNKEDWKRADWAADMVAGIGNDKYFRWFDSGDMYALGLAEKIYQVMKATPNCKHWLPTRMHKFPKFARMLSKMERLPNVVIRRSSDSVTGGTVRGKTTSTIIPTAEHATDAMTVCRAYERSGKCGDCRACWDKSIRVIAYPAHGAKMAKTIKLLEVA